MNVGAILAGGVALVRRRPGMVAVWGLAYLLACVALMATLAPMMAGMAEFQRAALATPPGAPPPPFPGGGLVGVVLLFELGFLVLMAAIFAAAVRATASPESDRFAFLRLGMDELRLLALGVLLWIGSVVAVLVFAIVAVILVGLLVWAMGPAALALAAILYVVALGAGLWVTVRLSLAGALTVLRGRIVLGEAWRATRGRFWTLFGAYLVIWLVFMAVTLVMLAVTQPEMLALLGRLGDPAAAQDIVARQQAMMADPFGPRMLATLLLGGVVNTVLIAWACGAVATAALAADTDGTV